MIASGWMILGALFCLLATLALVAIAFVGLRWFFDKETRSSSGPVAGRFD